MMRLRLINYQFEVERGGGTFSGDGRSCVIGFHCADGLVGQRQQFELQAGWLTLVPTANEEDTTDTVWPDFDAAWQEAQRRSDLRRELPTYGNSMLVRPWGRYWRLVMHLELQGSADQFRYSVLRNSETILRVRAPSMRLTPAGRVRSGRSTTISRLWRGGVNLV